MQAFRLVKRERTTRLELATLSLRNLGLRPLNALG
jgi:hypothetical protein